MRQIRWEEAVANRELKEEGKSKNDFNVAHSNCSCGSEECLGVPYYYELKDKEADAD